MKNNDKNPALGCAIVLLCFAIFVTQVVFLTMKITGAILWSWLFVLLPAILAIGVPLLALLLAIIAMIPKEVKKSIQKRKRIEAEAEQYGMQRKLGESDEDLKQRIIKRNMICGNYSRKDIRDMLLERFPDLASVQFAIDNQNNTIELKVRKAPAVVEGQIKPQHFQSDELRRIVDEAVQYIPMQYQVTIAEQEDEAHAKKGTE